MRSLAEISSRRWLRASCWLRSSWVLAAALGCNTDYLAPATACDDWCLASQRGQCPDDYPEKCVSECERTASPAARDVCHPEWQGRLSCYQAAPDESFSCRGGKSQRRVGVCEVEDALWLSCTGTNACAYHCLFQASLCDDAPLTCDACATWPPQCEDETESYLGCLIRDPGEVLCSPLLTISEVVCLEEGRAMLDCVRAAQIAAF